MPLHQLASYKSVQRQQARTELSTAIELYRAMEMTFWLPQTEAALAHVKGVVRATAMLAEVLTFSLAGDRRAIVCEPWAKCRSTASPTGHILALLDSGVLTY
jgi:hypothetical protein